MRQAVPLLGEYPACMQMLPTPERGILGILVRFHPNGGSSTARGIKHCGVGGSRVYTRPVVTPGTYAAALAVRRR